LSLQHVQSADNDDDNGGGDDDDDRGATVLSESSERANKAKNDVVALLE